MATTWIRTVQATLTWAAGSSKIASIPSGSTLLRVRFSWGFQGWTSSLIGAYTVMNDAQVLGLVTTIGNGSETVPNPRSDSTDADPPTRRWLWWEARVPVITAWDDASSIVTWRDSPPQEPIDAKGQVAATGIPGGDSLNLWASWAPAYAWDSSGAAALWYYASVLYKPTI
jgi:hypothetical protein